MVKFRTETGNAAEIDKCLAYIAASFDGTGAVVKIERFDDASPVIYISNNDSMTQDALVLGHIDVVKSGGRHVCAERLKTAECTGAEHWI